MAQAKQPIPAGHHTVTPVLTLDDAAKAIKWYEKAFDAKEIGRSTAPDGKILHAEIQIGDSRIMLNDPIMGAKSPKSLSGSPASLFVYVEDCDAFFERAVSAGAHVYGGTVGRMSDQFWGDRMGTPDGSVRVPMVDRHEKGGFVRAGGEGKTGKMAEGLRSSADRQLKKPFDRGRDREVVAPRIDYGCARDSWSSSLPFGLSAGTKRCTRWPANTSPV